MNTESDTDSAPAKRKLFSIFVTIVIVAVIAAAAAALAQKLLLGNVRVWVTLAATMVAILGTAHRSWREP